MTFDSRLSNSPSLVRKLTERCGREIPTDLHHLLLPVERQQWHAFLVKAKKLRIREIERNYVMELQTKHNLSVRPNESVKATMIRARLRILKNRLQKMRVEEPGAPKRIMPVDPLE